MRQSVPASSDVDESADGGAAVGVPPEATTIITGGILLIFVLLQRAVLAKQRGITVLSTTRNPARAAVLKGVGVDHVIIDDGEIAPAVREILPDGVSGAVELVGAPTLRDTLRATAVHGTVCFTGMLSDKWIVPDFYPMDYLPNGVRLTAYSGEASYLPPAVLQDFLDAVAAGLAVVPIGRSYAFDDIVQAHADMESGAVTGKLVVTTGSARYGR